MPAFHSLLPVALVAASLAVGCDEAPPSYPHPLVLMQATSNPEGDGQQAGAAFAQGTLREQMQLYFGARHPDDQ